ncbi:hypothetical protein cypCar_00047512, partial [Cyprinus carpio]
GNEELASPAFGLLFEDSSQKMSYTQQANKSYHCRRLTCFIRLADYLIVNTTHMLVVNTISKLLSVFQEHITHTPSLSLIQSWAAGETSPDPDVKVRAEQNVNTSHQPMFITEMMLDTHSLSYQPSNDDFQECVAEITGRFEKTVLSLDTLLQDSYFDAFTQPIINKKVEEKTCGDGPSLEEILEDDAYLQDIILNIKQSIQFAFNTANVYARTFEPFRLFYKENEELDLEALKEQDHEVAFFGNSLDKYHREHKEALAIKQKRPLGILLVDTAQLKQKLIPSPLRCIEVLNDILPRLAKKKMDDIIAEAQDAQFKLDFVPTITSEYVNSLNFLEEIQKRIVVLEKETETVCDMYKLIECYSVPTPPEDIAVFATLSPCITAIRITIDKAVGERHSYVDKFCQHLQQDINQLNKKVLEVKEQAENSQLLDIDADRSNIRRLLGDIQISIDELQTQAFKYKTYQKNFKVEVTKYEALEELTAEVKLKQLLWDSLEEWENLENSWLQNKFDELDPELLSRQVNKFAKYVSQLEKGLPKNNVVPCLKENVESMREKVGEVGTNASVSLLFNSFLV